MSDQPEAPQSDPAKTSTNVSGGVNTNAETSNVGGDVVGRDKITSIKIELSAIIIVVAALIIVVAIVALPIINRTPLPPPPTPSPTPSCISADDIIVAFHILRGTSEIATLSSGETVSIEPDSLVYMQAEITSVTDRTLPPLECTWMNTGIATEGSLLHNAGCRVDYRSGRSVIVDAVSMQLSQPACPALAPYPFFITPKPSAQG